VRFEFIEEAMNTDLFIGFMARLIADNRQKVFLILDNLKVHHATLVTAWLAEREDRIDVFYLPPYSPEINPDDYLNRDFKTELRSSDRATSKKALLQKASQFMEFLSKTPERVMAYFNHSAVQYAASQTI
jgi:transposase